MNLEGVQRLPFVGDTTVLGYGMNGAVTGHKIASGHLQNKHGVISFLLLLTKAFY